MTSVRIVFSPGAAPEGSIVIGRDLIVLADDTAHRAVPLWLRVSKQLWRLLDRPSEDGRPDLAVIDVRTLPAFMDEGLRAGIEIRRCWPTAALVVLSQFVEECSASEFLADNTDKIGYLLKDRISDLGDFIDALQRVADSGTALDPQVVSRFLARLKS